MTVTALAPVSAQAKDKTLTVAIWDNGQKAGLQEIMDEFTKETGIKTELQVVEWSSYWTLLEAGASGGDMPDVFWMHSNEAVRYMSNDILLDLTDKICRQRQTGKWTNSRKISKKCISGTEKHTQYRRTSIQLLCGTTKICLTEAGIDYPDGSWTWDEFYDIAEKLTKEDGSQYGFAANPSNEQDTWMNICTPWADVY